MKNVEVFWASLDQPNRKFAEPHFYQLTALPDEKTLAEFVSRGHRVKKIDYDGQGNMVDGLVFKQYEKRPDGSLNAPIRVVDINKNPFDMAVGNRSVCNIQYEERSIDNKYGKFQWNLLKAVQVLEHKPHQSSTEDEFDVEGGGDDIEF